MMTQNVTRVFESHGSYCWGEGGGRLTQLLAQVMSARRCLQTSLAQRPSSLTQGIPLQTFLGSPDSSRGYHIHGGSLFYGLVQLLLDVTSHQESMEEGEIKEG